MEVVGKGEAAVWEEWDRWDEWDRFFPNGGGVA